MLYALDDKILPALHRTLQAVLGGTVLLFRAAPLKKTDLASTFHGKDQ